MMILQVQQSQFVDWGNMVGILVALIGLIATITYIGFRKMSLSYTNAQKIEAMNTNFTADIQELKDAQQVIMTKLDNMSDRRNMDVLSFTEIVGKLNVTLGKIEVTLENTNGVMRELQHNLKEQEQKIESLRR